MAITIGIGYDLTTIGFAGRTFIELNNPANAKGTLDSFLIYTYNAITNLKMGTFYNSNGSVTMRDHVLIGNANQYQTFTGLSCNVETGDLLGAYWEGGYVWRHSGSTEFDQVGEYVLSLDAFDGASYPEGSLNQSYLFITGTGVEGVTVPIPDAPTNVAATKNQSDKVTLSWTKSTNATGYKIYRNSVLLATVGDVATYDDTTTDAPVITSGGVAVATDGTKTACVELSLSDQAIADGTTYTYSVSAINASGESAKSTTDTGYRLASTLTFQWQRSSADLSGSFADISGAITNPYNDTGAPSDGSIRQYRCTVSAVNSTSQYSSMDSGCRAVQTGGGGVSRSRIVNGV